MVGISVVIPAFGRLRELNRAIDSVATSSPDQAEIIVVDDCSAVPLAPLLQPANAQGVPIRVVRLSRNRGAGVARAYGIRRARYAYVAFLDSDDTFHPRKLDILRDHIAASGADLVFHPVEGTSRYNRLMQQWYRSGRWIVPFHWLIVLFNPIPTPALTVRRLPRLGHPWLRHAEDWAFLLRYVDRSTRIEYIPRMLASVHRPIGSPGGESGALRAMRSGEFTARRLLLREPSLGDVARFALGSAVGGARLVSDRARRLLGSR